MSNFNEFVRRQENKCIQYLEKFFATNESTTSCPPHFDGKFCWPTTPSMTRASIKCPLKDHASESMSRWCSANTSDTGGNITLFAWHNAQYAGCSLLRAKSAGITYLFALAFKDDAHDDHMDWWHEKFYVLDQIGYTLSTMCLLLALFIFWKFSHIQDTRVKVHINLFIAMLLHSFMALIHNFFYGCKIFFIMLVNADNYDDSQLCRALMTLSHYFELAMFTWLLIEGWYFYNFISRAPYHDYVTIRPHLIFGWGSPLIVMIAWVVVHVYTTQTNFCWVDLDMKINIIAVPILLIVLVNLCFFILNVRIVFIKMRCSYMSQKRTHYWRWIKSSLMLVPLFGTYDILYGIWPWIGDQQTKIAFLLIVRIICSFQGCIVAALYCFVNDHVKKEVQRAWKNWKLEREIATEISRQKCARIASLKSSIKFNDCSAKTSKSEACEFNLYL